MREKSEKRLQERQTPNSKNQSDNDRKGITKQLTDDGPVIAKMLVKDCRSYGWPLSEPNEEKKSDVDEAPSHT